MGRWSKRFWIFVESLDKKEIKSGEPNDEYSRLASDIILTGWYGHYYHLNYNLCAMGSSIKHLVKILGILNPLPLSWSLLLCYEMVIWRIPLPLNCPRSL